MRLGRIAGVPVGVHWSVAVILAVLTDGLARGLLPSAVEGQPTAAYWGTAAGVSLMFLGALLAHELAHAVVARRHGLQVSGITLWMLGGVAQLESNPTTARAELAVALAGPATSLGAAAAFAGIAAAVWALGLPALAVAGLAWLAGVNALLCVFNLLPGAPLDGGRVLRGALWLRWDDRARAQAAAGRAGRGLGGGLIALGALEALFTTAVLSGFWLAVIGWFILTAATAEAEAEQAVEAADGLTVADVMLREPRAMFAHHFVSSAIDRAEGDSQFGYPVIDMDGQIVGVITVTDLLGVPRMMRERVRVADVVRALPPPPVARPEERLDVVLARVRPGRPVAVKDGDELVGLLVPASVSRARAVGRSPERAHDTVREPALPLGRP